MAKSSKKDELKAKKKKSKKVKKLTKAEKELMISKHPKSRPGLYYGTDKLKWDPKRKEWIDTSVHSTRT